MRKLKIVVTVSAAGLICIALLLPLAMEAVESGLASLDLPDSFNFPEGECDLGFSIANHKGDCVIHAELNQTAALPVTLNFFRGQKKILAVRGHARSTFRSSMDTLYFADYIVENDGCVVVAYSLRDGTLLWRTKLKGIDPNGHKAYRNHVTVDLSGDFVVVKGHETNGDYIEILNCKSGRSLAHKVYRNDFRQRWQANIAETGRGPLFLAAWKWCLERVWSLQHQETAGGNELSESRERRTRCFFLSKMRFVAKKPRKTHAVEAGECLNFGIENYGNPCFSSVFANRRPRKRAIT